MLKASWLAVLWTTEHDFDLTRETRNALNVESIIYTVTLTGRCVVYGCRRIAQLGGASDWPRVAVEDYPLQESGHDIVTITLQKSAAGRIDKRKVVDGPRELLLSGKTEALTNLVHSEVYI